MRKGRENMGRNGTTLIELLVVLSVIATLTALLTPAVLNSRESARRMTCLSRMREVSLAVHNFGSAHDQRLPWLHDGAPHGSWARRLLPYLDQNALDRRLDDDPSLAATSLAVLTCPAAPSNHEQPGGLTHVANTGWILADLVDAVVAESHAALEETLEPVPPVDFDLDADELRNDATEKLEPLFARAAGVFRRRTSGRAPMTFDRIHRGDGLGTTLMFSENLQARRWHSGLPTDMAFGLILPLEALRDVIPGQAGEPVWEAAEWDLGLSAVNSDLDAPPGTRPRPSSFHRGGVNVTYCDGRGGFVSEQIDARVYARLLTYDGVRHGERVVTSSELE